MRLLIDKQLLNMQLSTNSLSVRQDVNLKVWIADDEQFLTELKTGNTNAFIKLFKQYSPGIYGHILRELKDEATSALILEAVFTEARNLISSYDDRFRLFTWLIKITNKHIKAVK